MVQQDERDFISMQREEALQWPEEYLCIFLQHSRDAIELLTADGTITYASESLQHILGYRPEDCIGADLFSAIHPDDLAQIKEHWHGLLHSPATSMQTEYRVLHKDSSWVWIELIATNHLKTPGIERIVGNMRDITQYKRAEAERNQLLMRERRARAEAEAARQYLYNLLMQAPAVICLLRGPQHVYELANPLYFEIIGQRDLLGKAIREALPELEGQGILEILDQVYTTGEPFIGNEVRVDIDRQHNGQLQETYFNFVYQPTRNIMGEVDGILVHAVDVTEEVRTRQKVQESEARLRRLVDSNIIGVSFTNLNGAIIDANDNFLRMVGYTREDVLADKLSWSRMTPAEYSELDRNALEEIRRFGAVSSPYLKEYISKDGKRIPVLAGGASIDRERGEIVTFVIDMRQQKLMEEEVRRAKDQFEAILHNVANGITVHDSSGTLLYANDVAANMLGFPSAETMRNASLESYQQILSRLIVKDAEGNIVSSNDFPGRRALREGKTIQVLFEYSDTQSGHMHWSLIKSQPIFNEDGQAQLVVNVMTDVSEQQALEQRKNEFISMASHELKTPVTALKGFVALLQRRSSRQEDEQAQHYLTRMDGQLNKLANLVNDLLDLSKIQVGSFAMQEETVDLTALIDEIVENIQGTTATHHIHVEEVPGIYITGDKDRLGQVLINLLTNAIKYSPKAETVIVRTMIDGEQAVVSVQDFGIGIAEAHQQHVFERFYQVTDPQEKTYPGLGIGLYIASDIVKRHHGTMWLESRKGQGTTFFFTVPLAQGPTIIENQ